MEKNVTKYNFSFPKGKYVLLFGIFPLFFLFISKAVYIQGQTLSVFLGCFFYLIEKRKRNRNKRDEFTISLTLLLIIGTINGIIFLVLGYNDLFKFVQYSFLSFACLFAYKFGANISEKELINLSLFLFLSEIALFFVILLNGFESRTSIGASNLFPLALTLLLNKKGITKKTFLLTLSGLIIYVLITLTSGMRSVIGVTLISAFLIFIRQFFFSFNKVLKLSFVSVVIYILVINVLPRNITDIILNRVNVVQQRFERTLFSDEGIKYDEDDSSGRKLESKSAMNEFFKRDIPYTYFTGFGHGYYYFDKMQGRSKSHLHITYNAFFVRYGIVGVLIYLLLFIIILRNMVTSFLNKNDVNDISFALCLSSLQVLVISLFAASLTFLINWIIIGITINSLKRTEG